jgi:carboxyl-terminal processing protease
MVERAKVTAYDTSRRIKEADLSGHLDNVNGDNGDNGNRKTTSSRKLSSELLASDNQLYEALTLLKGINVLGMRNPKTREASDSETTGES